MTNSAAAPREVRVAPAGYAVRIGAGVLSEASARLAGRPAQLVADEHVLALHGGRLAPELRAEPVALPRGEACKRWEVLGACLERLSEAQLARDAVVVTLGGGAATDLGGLAASLYQRGIDVLHCPTSLLACVDASVGGKTAVNLTSAKNLVGTFWPPTAVLCDTDCLATLEEHEWRSGLGEILKAALLEGDAALARLEQRAAALCDRAPRAVTDTIAECVAHKAAVVAADERESDARQALNLGHTFAHALERAAGYGALPHGIAVAAGIGLALEASERFDLLRDPKLRERAARLARALGLPAGLAELRAAYPDLAFEPEALLSAMAHDKKGRAGEPRFVGLERAGQPRWNLAWDEAALARMLEQPGP